MSDLTNRRAILITIPLSHYCEKARWGLDRTGLPYDEEPHAPLVHLLATKRHHGGTVPLLVHGNTRFTDSTDILVHADAVCGGDVLYPRATAMRREVETLEDVFNRELGPNVRRWAYGQLLSEAKLLRSLLAAPVLFPGECRAAHPALDAVPPSMREEVLRLRDTEAGKFALRLFAEERAHES